MACPICKTEWTKLKSCKFIWNGKDDRDSICVECAETVKSFEKLLDRYPIEKLVIQGYGFHGPAFITWKDEKITQWRNKWVAVEHPIQKALITSHATGIVLAFDGGDTVKCDNILEALSRLDYAIRNAAPQKNSSITQPDSWM